MGITMGEVINVNFKRERSDSESAIDVPENATLLHLCDLHYCRAVERGFFGPNTIFVFFDFDGIIHLYQIGDSIETAHLFFWVASAPFDEGADVDIVEELIDWLQTDV